MCVNSSASSDVLSLKKLDYQSKTSGIEPVVVQQNEHVSSKVHEFSSSSPEQSVMPSQMRLRVDLGCEDAQSDLQKDRFEAIGHEYYDVNYDQSGPT